MGPNVEIAFSVIPGQGIARLRQGDKCKARVVMVSISVWNRLALHTGRGN